jgi:pimeloyl-ACP methyl ester carboxylesterase
MKRVAFLFLIGFAVLLGGAAVWALTPDRPLSELEPLYLRAPADYVEVAGIRLHVRDDGPRDAPAVIMLHGFASSLHTWEPWAAALSGGYRVVRYDQPGFGLTGKEPGGDYSDDRGVAILSALMDRLEIRNAVLVGNSMGGKIAWKFAVAHPGRVNALVLVSPDGFASPGFQYGKAPSVPAIMNLMAYALPKAMLRASLEPAYADPKRLTGAIVDRYYDMMLAPGVREAILARMKQTILVDPVPLLAQINAPVLLLWGEKDGMIPFSNAQDYLQVLPDARLVSLPDLGHVPFEEDPAASLTPVKDFLSSLPRPAASP